MISSVRFYVVLLAAILFLGGCASAPPVPDWQLNARNAVEKATRAEMQGLRRVADVEWRRAVEETRRTADPMQVARVGLVQCAVQQASLFFGDCGLWRAWAADASLIDQAYGRYLSGTPELNDIPLLPAVHQSIARLMLADTVQPRRQALLNISDPLSRLVAAGGLFRVGLLDLDGVSVAVDTASEMGWHRPLASWLALQAQEAHQQGHDDLALRAQRRLELLSAEAAAPRAQKAD